MSSNGGVWCGVSQGFSSGLVWTCGSTVVCRISAIRIVHCVLEILGKLYHAIGLFWAPLRLMAPHFSERLRPSNRTETDELRTLPCSLPPDCLAERDHGHQRR